VALRGACANGIRLDVLVLATLGISLAAGSVAAFTHILEQRVDAIMVLTRARPLPAGKLTPRQAIIFAAILALASMTTLAIGVNTLTAALTFLSLIGYSVIYTLFLKPATPQNILIGGGRWRRATPTGVDCGDGKYCPRCVALVCHYLRTDAAAFLVAGHVPRAGVRESRHPDAVGHA
jgi:hypothetical protein